MNKKSDKKEMVYEKRNHYIYSGIFCGPVQLFWLFGWPHCTRGWTFTEFQPELKKKVKKFVKIPIKIQGFF